MTLNAGLVISALCGDVDTAMQVAIAAFYPVLVLSGEFEHVHAQLYSDLCAYICMYRCAVAS